MNKEYQLIKSTNQ